MDTIIKNVHFSVTIAQTFNISYGIILALRQLLSKKSKNFAIKPSKTPIK